MDIPESHLDLIEKPVVAVLTPLMPDGQPQSTLVWCDHHEGVLRINTALGRQKTRNLDRDPRVSVLILDPSNSSRWIEVRGMAVQETAGALEHLDHLTRQYTEHDRFYGGLVPLERQAQETRVILSIQPVKINCDAIHN
jgi:PPOX class probable F420-dependent enzyme